jgi:hypothetical protein
MLPRPLAHQHGKWRNASKRSKNTLRESNPKIAPDQDIHTDTHKRPDTAHAKPLVRAQLEPLVEMLTAYSHSAQAADLRLCHTVALSSPVRAPRPGAQHPWSLRDRLGERQIADLITAYRDGATAASLAAAHGVSLKSVKRLLHTVGIRRTPPTRRSAKTTPTATHP